MDHLTVEPEMTEHPGILIGQQLMIANVWVARADGTTDLFYEFICRYMAFNALYFVWRRIDPILSAQNSPPEKTWIDTAVEQLTDDADRLLVACQESIEFFVGRDGVRRMDKRTVAEPITGDPTEGQGHVLTLRDGEAPAVGRLVALARLVYLVRCNLMHGGKIDSGSDEHVVANALSVLKAIVPSLYSVTQSAARPRAAAAGHADIGADR